MESQTSSSTESSDLLEENELTELIAAASPPPVSAGSPGVRMGVSVSADTVPVPEVEPEDLEVNTGLADSEWDSVPGFGSCDAEGSLAEFKSDDGGRFSQIVDPFLCPLLLPPPDPSLLPSPLIPSFPFFPLLPPPCPSPSEPNGPPKVGGGARVSRPNSLRLWIVWCI